MGSPGTRSASGGKQRRGEGPPTLGASLRRHFGATETLLALAVCAWATVGVLATSPQAVWYEVEVRSGAESVSVGEAHPHRFQEARVARAAFALAALIAGYRVVVAGRFAPLPCAGLGLLAGGALGRFLYELDRHGRTIDDVRALLGDPGGGDLFGLEPALHFRSGFYLTAAASAGLVVFGLAGFWAGHRARRRALEATEGP